jgi:hypothetical protein
MQAIAAGGGRRVRRIANPIKELAPERGPSAAMSRNRRPGAGGYSAEATLAGGGGVWKIR